MVASQGRGWAGRKHGKWEREGGRSRMSSDFAKRNADRQNIFLFYSHKLSSTFKLGRLGVFRGHQMKIPFLRV